jgi:hypothetical protein
MLIGLAALGIAFVPLFPVVHTGNVVLIGICTAGTLGSIIFAFSAQASFYAYAFAVRERYFGSSISYAITNVIFGGTAAVAATWLLGLAGRDVRIVVAYGVVLVVASFLAVLARPAQPETVSDPDGEEGAG